MTIFWERGDDFARRAGVNGSDLARRADPVDNTTVGEQQIAAGGALSRRAHNLRPRACWELFR